MDNKEHRNIWVFAEQENGIISETTYELLAKSRDLSEKLGAGDKIVAVLLGANIKEKANALFSYGADEVIIVQNDNLSVYSARPYEKVLKELAEKYKPSIFLFAASPIGRDVAPRVMCKLGTGLTADAIDLDINENGIFVQTTPNFGGSILSHIAILEKRPQMVTVHPKVFSPIAPISNASGKLVEESVEVDADKDYVLLSSEPKVFEGRPINSCPVLVAGGQGIESEDDLKQLSELASLLGGELACSRPVCDNGWLTHDKQIGQSGSMVKPEFIVNVAISGSVQYLAGMQKSKCIMSINHTKSAPIYDVSHYGAIIDYQELIPAVIAEIKRRKV